MSGRAPKDARRWYAEHHVDVIPEDWGKRDPETGEGLENVGHAYWGDSGDARRSGLHRIPGGDFLQFVVWLEEGGRVSPLWSGRTDEEREVIEALEDFFTPYIATLPKGKASVLDQYLGQRRTQEQIASARGVSQQAVSKQLRAAVRALVRRIAEDAPGYSEDPSKSAWFVFERYWRNRFCRSFNG
jgi:hypothetical protein